jgi:ElaA protein
MAAALHRIAAESVGWRVTLAAQAHLVRFYQGFGFVATSAPYDDYGISHVDMALPGVPTPGL